MKVKPTSKVVLSEKNFKTIAKSSGFEYFIDTTLEKGGSNSGPTPVEYFLAAIGGCVSITLRTYADKMKWDLGEITVEVREDTKLTQLGIVKTILEDISVEKSATQEQLDKLREVAKSCPVAQMVSGQTNIIRTIENKEK